MTFAQWRIRLTTHFSERISVVKRRMTIHRVKIRAADCILLGRQTRGNLRVLDQVYRMSVATLSNLILWSLISESWNLSASLHCNGAASFYRNSLPQRLDAHTSLTARFYLIQLRFHLCVVEIDNIIDKWTVNTEGSTGKEVLHCSYFRQS